MDITTVRVTLGELRLARLPAGHDRDVDIECRQPSAEKPSLANRLVDDGLQPPAVTAHIVGEFAGTEGGTKRVGSSA